MYQNVTLLNHNNKEASSIARGGTNTTYDPAMRHAIGPSPLPSEPFQVVKAKLRLLPHIAFTTQNGSSGKGEGLLMQRVTAL